MTFPWIDLLFLLLALVGAAGGWRRGALRIAVGAAGAFTGLVLAVLLIRLVPTGPQLHPAVTLLAGLAGAGIGAALVHPAGRLLTRAAHALGLGLMDRAGGLLLGGVGTLVAGWLLLLAAVAGGGLPPAGTALADSRVATALSARLPAVPVLANRLQLPAAVTGLLPSSHPNRLDVPTGSQAVAARVAASTVLVTGSNCTGGTLGSGVVVAPRRVATAAHVVAGMTAPTVSTPGGGTLRASVVSYNPAADLAVLAVPDLTALPSRSVPGTSATAARWWSSDTPPAGRWWPAPASFSCAPRPRSCCPGSTGSTRPTCLPPRSPRAAAAAPSWTAAAGSPPSSKACPPPCRTGRSRSLSPRSPGS